MPYVDTVPEGDAEGALARQYEASRRRDGRVAGIVKALGRRPRALDELMRLYATVAHGPSGLSRAEREMIAVVASRATRCRY